MIGRLARFISSSCLQFTIEIGQYAGHHRTDALAFNGMESLAIPWKETGCHKEEYLANDTSIAKLDMVYFGKVKLVFMFLKDVNHSKLDSLLGWHFSSSSRQGFRGSRKSRYVGFRNYSTIPRRQRKQLRRRPSGVGLGPYHPSPRPPAHHNSNQKIDDNHQRLIKKPFCFGILESWSPSQWWIPPEQLESVERNVCTPKDMEKSVLLFF